MQVLALQNFTCASLPLKAHGQRRAFTGRPHMHAGAAQREHEMATRAVMSTTQIRAALHSLHGKRHGDLDLWCRRQD